MNFMHDFNPKRNTLIFYNNLVESLKLLELLDLTFFLDVFIHVFLKHVLTPVNIRLI